MKKWIGYSLRRKLSLIILISTLLPLLSFGAFTYLISSRITEEKTKQSGIDTLEQMEGKMSFIVSDIENISLILIGHRDIQQYLSHSVEDEQTRTRVLEFIMNLSSSKPYISNITIYPGKFQTAPLSNSTVYASNMGELVDLYQVKEKTWTGLYKITNFSGERQVISFIRPLRSVFTYENLGWLVISVDEPVISEYWSEPSLGEGGEVALLNESGVVLSSTEKSWLSRPFDDLFPGVTQRMMNRSHGETVFGAGREKRTVLYYRQPSTGWTFAGTIPYDLYSSQNRYILQLTAIAVLVMIVITGCLVLFVIRRVTNPLTILTRLLTKVNPNGPMPLYHASSRDEIGRLGESYNMLGMHIEQLKRQLIRDETRKKEADMRALQAQINPHFLYNTLSSIHWMALMADKKRIADMVGALSDFLQFSLNKGNDYCAVQQELAHIRNYVDIQSIRFPDKFEVDYVIDPGVHDRMMLKLLLQPLLENSMIHGVQKKAGKGKIAVCIHQEGGRLHFLVVDDGVGMTEERLAQVMDNLDRHDLAPGPDASYGLRNVNERLRLHYGQDACLVIESKPNAGTRISFSIPGLEESYENHDRG
ncbi:cache domain-containing sensor histidine kinase [Cohnella panacarvi]|uniref:cache domain-containing sensor histidine kinase n=1 Tax=Cohnella panacarvi TaxID=400776 RepID=UPI00047BB0AE|nr:sensor histidine kinase [Cohnella panacarvi]